ncbi:MAG: DUF5110 domain-containing protein, partial [Chitinophagaceae bacterium]
GQYQQGGSLIRAAAGYERMPVFVKAGSILPVGPELQYTAEKKADTIHLRVYEGANGSFSLYEDEGLNYNYEKGLFANISFVYDDQSRSLRIGGREGEFPGMLQTRTFIVQYLRKGRASNTGLLSGAGKVVKYNGSPQVVRLN